MFKAGRFERERERNMHRRLRGYPMPNQLVCIIIIARPRWSGTSPVGRQLPSRQVELLLGQIFVFSILFGCRVTSCEFNTERPVGSVSSLRQWPDIFVISVHGCGVIPDYWMECWHSRGKREISVWSRGGNPRVNLVDMFFCPGSIGLLNDDEESDWDIDNFYNHSSSIQAFHHHHHHHGDHDSKFSKMGSLMFVVDFAFFFLSRNRWLICWYILCTRARRSILKTRREISLLTWTAFFSQAISPMS